MGAIKDYVNQGFAVGDITVSTYDETGARIRIKDFYDLDLIERQRVVNFAGKVDVELLNIENKITVETDGKFSEYYKSSEIDTKFYNKSETDGKLSSYPTKSEVSSNYVPKTLEAQESIKGITNFKDMKKQVNYLSGAEYKDNNEFGSNLKSIIKGEMYYYGTKPYIAIKTVSNASGFLAPDSTNFADITNKNLNTILNTNLIDTAVVESNQNPSTVWKFMRFGKIVFFTINYYFATPTKFPSLADIADYPAGFKPSSLFYNAHYDITNSGDVSRANLLISQNRIYLVGHDPNTAISAIRGTIIYMAE